MSHNRENPLYPTVRGEGGVAGEGKLIAWLARSQARRREEKERLVKVFSKQTCEGILSGSQAAEAQKNTPLGGPRWALSND